MADALRQWAPDVVIAHNVEAPLAAWLGERLARRRVPVLYALHTSLEEELPTYLASGLTQRVARPLGGVVDRLLARGSTAALALSGTAAQRLQGWGASEVVLSLPGIDPEEVRGGDAARARAQWSLGERPWVLYAGNLDAYQDLDDAVAAVAARPELCLLVVTGAEAEVARERCASVPPERLRVVSSHELSDLKDALAAATVAVLPRTTCSGFPMKLLNFLAAGLPVVQAEGATQERLPGTVAVPDHDPRALGEALAAVCADPTRRRALSEAACAWVDSEGSWVSRVTPVIDWARSATGR